MEKMTISMVKTECCIICEEEKEQGIHLFESFICESCEESMRATDPRDDYYKYYVKQLKKIQIPTSG